MRTRVSEAAKEDAKAAVRWYNSKPSRYGKVFNGEFNAAVRAITANPRLYSRVEDGITGHEVREFFIDRFEQRIIYTVDDKSVTVIAVVHASRRPGSWHQRLFTEN